MNEYESVRPTAFSCPSCGGRMVFSPADQQLKCPYCGTLKPFQVSRETPNEFDIRYAPPTQDTAWGDRTRVLRCGKCGVELVTTGETELTECPFCGSAEIAESDSGNGIAPENMIPFQVPQKQAEEICRKWVRMKIFACRPFRKMALSGKLTGLYLPHWTYIDDASSRYTGKAGRYYEADIPYTVTDSDGKERRETRKERLTRWEAASGTLEEHFDDVLIPASDRLPEQLINDALPYRMSRMTRYMPECIAGYACEKPVLDVQEGWKQAQGMVDRRMAVLAERELLARADEAKVQQLETTHYNVRYKLVLLPVYLAACQYRGRPRRILINGESGRLSGRAPLSPLKVGIAVLLVLALILGLGWLFMARGGSDYMLYDFGGRIRTLL